MIAQRHTIQTICTVMRADGGFTDAQVAMVSDFLRRGERSALSRMTLAEAQRELGICKYTLHARLNDPAWQERGLRRIRESSRKVFVDRQVVLEIKEGKR